MTEQEEEKEEEEPLQGKFRTVQRQSLEEEEEVEGEEAEGGRFTSGFTR